MFDIEANGLLDTLDKIHCLHLTEYTDKTSALNVMRFDKEKVKDGLKILEDADVVCGHNIIKYDYPAISKVYPEFNPKKDQEILDTLIWSQIVWPDIGLTDIGRIQKGSLPKAMQGKHSLEAYGFRLGEYKGDFKGPWDTWTKEMSDYCEQDVKVNSKLLKKLLKQEVPDDVLKLEMNVAKIISRQEKWGFQFNEKKAAFLYAEIKQRQEDLKRQLQEQFPPWYQKDKEIIPKRKDKRMHYVPGCPVTKIKKVEFNPGSRQHIIRFFKQTYGWQPVEFTDKGRPKVDEEILEKLPYPEAKQLAEYLMLEKRLGQIGDGDNSWLKLVKNGRIYGSVNTVGTVSGRMTHSKPNVANVPSLKNAKGKVPYGAECRELFEATDGYLLLGCDAEGLELRNMAHYLGRYDGGSFTETILKGNKEDKTDIHSLNQKAAGLDTRDRAKRFVYGFIYGAGDFKLGMIVTEGDNKVYTPNQLTKIGKTLRAKFLKNFPALKKLQDAVQKRIKKDKQLKGLDGRILKVRSAHSALNLLFQSAGAIIMKRALVILDERLQELSYVPGVDYEFCANVHDEFQMDVLPEHKVTIGEEARKSMQKAGEYYNCRCPLDGAYDIGNNWKETH